MFLYEHVFNLSREDELRTLVRMLEYRDVSEDEIRLLISKHSENYLFMELSGE